MGRMSDGSLETRVGMFLENCWGGAVQQQQYIDRLVDVRQVYCCKKCPE